MRPLDAAAAADAVRRGRLRALLTIPAGFGDDAPRALFGGRDKPTIEIRYDPSQAIELQVVEGLLTQHVMEAVTRSAFSAATGGDVTSTARADVEGSTALSADRKRDLLALLDSVEKVRRDPEPATGAGNGTGAGLQLPYATKEIAAQSATRYNSYSHSFVGMGVQFILFMGIDLGIKLLTMRRLGLWQRLRAAPLTRGFLLGSQVASGALIASLMFAIIFAAGMLLFGVRIDGSVVGFLAMIVAFGCMTAAFGLFIAALGRTPEATRGLAILATLLMVMLGGAWVPAFVFPRWLQTVSLAVPTRWAVDGFDAVTWRGLGFEAAWPPLLVMIGSALVFGAIAVWRFEWDERA